MYANVCRDGTPIEHQLRELESMAAKKGWQIVGQYVDTESSSANEFRHGFDCLCHAMERHLRAGRERATYWAGRDSINPAAFDVVAVALLMGLLGH